MYVYEHEDVCDGVCGGEACDGGGVCESGISGISEMVDSSAKRFCSATGVPSSEFVTHTDKSGKNTVLGYIVLYICLFQFGDLLKYLQKPGS